MENIILIDIIGYTALVIALISFAQSDMKHLRSLGVLASLVFFAQSFLIGATSLMVANLAFGSLHLYHWIKINNANKEKS